MKKGFNLLGQKYLTSLRWGFGLIIITFVKQIIFVPLFLEYFSDEIFAFWLIANAILLVLRSLSLGLYNFIINEINLGFSVLNQNERTVLVQNGYSTLFIVSLIQMALGLLFISPSFTSAITQFPIDFLKEVSGGNIILLLILSKIPNQFVMLFFVRLYEPIGRIDKTIKLQFISDLIDVIVTIIFILVTKQLYLTVIAIFCTTNILNIIYLLLISSDLKFTLKVPLLKTKTFFHHIRKSSTLGYSFIVEKLYENGINLVIARAYIPSFVALFGTGRILSNSALRLSNTVAEPLMPHMQKNFASKDFGSIQKVFLTYWRITHSLALIFILVLLPFLQDLFQLWTQGSLPYKPFLFICLFAAMFLQNFTFILTQFLRRTNSSMILLFYNLIRIVLSVFLLFLFGQYLWSWGLGMAILIGELFSAVYLLYILRDNVLEEKYNEIRLCFIYIFLSAIGLIVYQFADNLFLLIAISACLLYALNQKKINNLINDPFI